MKRRLLNLLTALSLLLCGVVVGAGVASVYLPPFGQMWGTSWDGNGSGHVFRGWVAYGGSFHLFRDDRIIVPPIRHDMVQHFRPGTVRFLLPELEPTTLGFARFGRVSSWQDPLKGTVRRTTLTRSQLSLPLWLAAVLLAVPTAVRCSSLLRKHQRRATSRCDQCGYDLRATPDRCPECGEATATTPA